MLVLMQINFAMTNSLSIAIVAQSMKKKYLLQDYRSHGFLMLYIMVSLNRKHELFRQYKNGIFTFDHFNSFKNNFTTAQRHATKNYSKKKCTEFSNNSRDTWKTLNSLIRCNNKSKDVILNHNMAPQSVTPQSLSKYLITIFET